MYMATTDFNPEERFKPTKFANTEVENKINQYENIIPFISRIVFPTITNRSDCIADNAIK